MHKRLDGIEFTRKELYDMLTEKPVSRIAVELEIDPRALTKEISASFIPRRSSGDWSRISLGMEVPREELSGNPDTIVFVPYLKPKTVPDKQNDEYSYPIMPVHETRKPTKKKKKGKHPKVEVNPAIKFAQDRLGEYNHLIPLYQMFGLGSNDESFSNIPLLELDLSVRSMNGLMRGGINNLHDILSLNIDDLFQIRNLGVTSIDSIIKTCQQYCIKHEKKLTKMPIEATKSLPDISSSNDNSLFVQLMMEFYQLNQTGQEIAVETLKGLTCIDRFKAK